MTLDACRERGGNPGPVPRTCKAFPTGNALAPRITEQSRTPRPGGSARRNHRRLRRCERLLDCGLDVHGPPCRYLTIELNRGELLPPEDERFERAAHSPRDPSPELLLDACRSRAKTHGAWHIT